MHLAALPLRSQLLLLLSLSLSWPFTALVKLPPKKTSHCSFPSSPPQDCGTHQDSCPPGRGLSLLHRLEPPTPSGVQASGTGAGRAVVLHNRKGFSLETLHRRHRLVPESLKLLPGPLGKAEIFLIKITISDFILFF